ncbi:helix-turn-helix transcriptional regulator [Burkholderia gladioli]|uniref:AraC family transcriptional regulator n=1 Tax=Burkholderia gladioli TaxID=28095 RepID=A0AAW3F5Z1_BURGA|nr:AraC family transcriptional regulator [Burkholderia gladioli]AJW93925.1 helix-turn-helix domain protein [Burkholderia gladioli]ASD82735.1 AraC family transcriptional regulator [Burkholderia gladioli pv. gladioli]AWY50173.1 AraC family transcriptional regulator [Burkholderia gladioli pv. gladioli]KGC15391.1 helix-turn-helix domain protein [Burkholderia gladioli]MBU9268857.1 AraC family transcriptional regulator [Burkholderia gladioli]
MTARLVRLPVAAAPCVARSVSSAIDDVLRTIDASFAQPLSLDMLAAVAGLSVSRFTARFRNEVGLSPHRYLCLVRVRRAQDLLCDGLAPSLVATEVGFFDQSHLCRHFRRVLGVTPRDFVIGRPGGVSARRPSMRTRAECRDASRHAA